MPQDAFADLLLIAANYRTWSLFSEFIHGEVLSQPRVCIGPVEPEPKQFWMAGAGAKNF